MRVSDWIRKNCRFAQTEPWRVKFDEFLQSHFPGLTYAQIVHDRRDEYKKVRDQWNKSIMDAISFGKISQEEAKRLGFLDLLGGEKVTDLPQVLYHVTTAKDQVARMGLKTRSELSQGLGGGLGGGTDKAISFTDDLNVARAIKNSLLEGRKVANGQISIQDMIEMARKGTGAQKPWLGPWFNHYFQYENQENRGEIPKEIQRVLNGVEYDSSFPETQEEFNASKAKSGIPSKGWVPAGQPWPHGQGPNDPPRYTEWQRKLSPAELRNKWFDLYKSFLFWREQAGGQIDPLFFGSDPSYLASVPEDQIAILQFKPRPGTKGWQVSALGEWRVFNGSTVELVGEVD